MNTQIGKQHKSREDRSLLSRERKATMAFFGRKWTMMNANVSSGFHSCPLVLIRGSSCMP